MRALVPFALLPVVLLGPTSTAPAVAGAVGAHAVAPVGTSATIPSDGPDAGGVVSVTIPAGTLSLSAGAPQTGPEGCAVEVVVTDTRPGNGGFTLQATGDDVRLTAAQVPGNVMDPRRPRRARRAARGQRRLPGRNRPGLGARRRPGARRVPRAHPAVGATGPPGRRRPPPA